MVQLITGAMGNLNGRICGAQQDIDAQYNDNENVTMKWTLQFAHMEPGFGAVIVDNASVNVSIYGAGNTLLTHYVLKNEPRAAKGHMFRVIQVVIIMLVVVVAVGAIFALGYLYYRNKHAKRMLHDHELRASLVE